MEPYRQQCPKRQSGLGKSGDGEIGSPSSTLEHNYFDSGFHLRAFVMLPLLACREPGLSHNSTLHFFGDQEMKRVLLLTGTEYNADLLDLGRLGSMIDYHHPSCCLLYHRCKIFYA